jgi:hypothetical protein
VGGVCERRKGRACKLTIKMKTGGEKRKEPDYREREKNMKVECNEEKDKMMNKRIKNLSEM